MEASEAEADGVDEKVSVAEEESARPDAACVFDEMNCRNLHDVTEHWLLLLAR